MIPIMSKKQPTNPAPATMVQSKYSSRVVVLKSVLESKDHGAGLVGRRVLVGGWVRSSKEIKLEALPGPTLDAHAPASSEALATRDVSCSEILQSKIPFIRSIIKILGGSAYSSTDKCETCAPRQQVVPPPSTAFLQVSDGSCGSSLLVIVESSIAPTSHLLPTGTCIVAEGELKPSTFDAKHAIELRVEKLLHLGTVESDNYPLSKKRLPLNTLRDCPHFRARTTTVATIMRIRSALSLAVHTFPQNQGFFCVQLPIITSTDSQGNTNEKFHVTTSLNSHLTKKEDQPKPRPIVDDTEGISLDAVKAAVKEKSKIIDDFKRTDSNKEALVAATRDLQKTLELASKLEERDKSKTMSLVDDKISCDQDMFFSRQTHLALSGRLHLESYACSLGKVYDFGPRFRPTKNESTKQVSEMWTVEMEMAFSELEDAMNCAEDFFKFLCKWVLEKCLEDMTFVVKRMDRTSIDRLHSVISTSFEKITYSEALNVLNKLVIDNKKAQTKLEWGLPLTTEQLSILADGIYKRPVIIYNYPKQTKPFYARLNDDRQTVAAFDIVIPRIGTLVSGSQNEERLNILSGRLKELGLVGEEYEWYLDLRRHGTAKHAGFSFSFDLMILYATGLADVRDVIPFTRTHGKIIN